MENDMSAEIANAILTLFMLVFVLYVAIAYLLSLIFEKAGVKKWKAWIPVYSTWLTLELGGQKGWIALLTLVPIVNIIGSIYLYIAMYYIGLKFGKDNSFVLWALFLPLVWYSWLAFDDSTWDDSAVA